MENCNHREYIPMLFDKIRSGVLDPEQVLDELEPMTNVLDAYTAFDKRQPGWIKVGTEAARSKAA